MSDKEHYTRMSFVKKTMLFIFFLIIVSGTLFVVAHMSWLGSIGSIFETVGPDDFTTTGVELDQEGDEFVYTSRFTHQGITSIDTSRVSVNVSVVSEGDLRQFSLSIRRSTTQFGDYTIVTEGFLSEKKVEKVDQGTVEIRSPHRIDNVSVCILYRGTPVSCSGENKITA